MEKQVTAYFDTLLKENAVVLFMKGTRERPECGFSKQVVEVLDSLLFDYTTINVLADPKIRDGIKAYSDWPTIPQLYVDQNFVGGCDIVLELFEKNEIQELFHLEKAVDIPFLKITDMAQEALEKAQEDCDEGEQIRLRISVDFQHSLSFEQKSNNDFVIQFGELNLIIDPYSALKAEDLLIDYVQENLDAGFIFTNPNEPPLVRELSVNELKAFCDEGKNAVLIDVRPEKEQALAMIPFAKPLAKMTPEEIKLLKKNQALVFHCHHGGRSRRAAENFRLKGFTELYNLTGGIDAWSKQIDPSVPVYTLC